MLVRMLTHRVESRDGIGVTVQLDGEVVDLPGDDALALIRSGQAEAVAEGEQHRRSRRVTTPKEARSR